MRAKASQRRSRGWPDADLQLPAQVRTVSLAMNVPCAMVATLRCADLSTRVGPEHCGHRREGSSTQTVTPAVLRARRWLSS